MIKLQVNCGECRRIMRVFELSEEIDTDLTIVVQPCDVCRKRAEDAAYNEGRQDESSGQAN